MDLPTCPSCQQSVLDDDVDECPFCGASMSGKPVSAKATSQQDPEKTAAAKKQPTPAAEKPVRTTSETAPADEDDPFELEKKAEAKAVRLRQKPEQGRSHKVVCPMCETPGFTARKAAGMQVRCANSECVMPVFTAPLLEKQSNESEEQESRSSKATIVGIASVVILGGAFALWYFVFSGDKVKPAREFAKLDPNKQAVIPINKTKEKTEKKKTKSIETGPKISRGDLEKLTLDRLKKAANDRSNDDKPFRRETAALVFASAGQLDEARDQIRKLENIAPNLPYHRVEPWLEIGWWHLKQNSSSSKDESQAAGKKAEECFRNIPSTGDLRFKLTTARAAFLYATGEKERAGKLLEAFASLGEAEVAAIRKLALEKLLLFDRERHRARTFYSVEGDLSGAAVALELVSRNRRDLAFAWATERVTQTGKGDALLAWVDGEMFRSREQFQAASEFQSKIQTLNPELKVLVFAHIAAFDQVHSEDYLQLAKAEFAKFPQPEPIVLKTVRDVSLSALTQKKWIPLAVAAFQLHIAKNIVSGNDGGGNASSTIEKGIDYLRSVTPGIEVVRELQHQQQTDSASLRQEISKEFQLTDRTAIDIQTREHKQTLQTMGKNASQRFRFQVAMLSWVSVNANVSQLENLWKALQNNRTEKELNRKEPYFETTLPWLLIALLESRGEQSKAKSFQTELSNLKIVRPDDAELVTLVVKDLAKLDTTKLADAISSSGNELLQLECSLIFAARLLKAGEYELAIRFANRIEEGTLKQDIFGSIGGLCIAHGKWDEIAELTQSRELQPAEVSALCRGISRGLRAVE